MRAPRSYTGEDIVEFHCHGGLAVISAVIDTARYGGARNATAGEFKAFDDHSSQLRAANLVLKLFDSFPATELARNVDAGGSTPTTFVFQTNIGDGQTVERDVYEVEAEVIDGD